jgi:hypothetical protein
MTALTDDTILQRVADIFAARLEEPRPNAGYGMDRKDCCLTGAVYLICTDGRSTYESALETQTAPVGPLRSAFERTIQRLYDAIPKEQRSTIRTVPGMPPLMQKCRVIESWYDRTDDHAATLDLVKRA